jgi:type II secretory pathway component PulJ
MSFSLWKFIHRQHRWSRATFGPRKTTKSITNHIRKELLEIEAHPSDLGEWIDVIILALDGAWRTGKTASEIVQALDAKLAINESRQWPNWRRAELGSEEPVEHIR